MAKRMEKQHCPQCGTGRTQYLVTVKDKATKRYEARVQCSKCGFGTERFPVKGIANAYSPEFKATVLGVWNGLKAPAQAPEATTEAEATA